MGRLTRGAVIVAATAFGAATARTATGRTPRTGRTGQGRSGRVPRRSAAGSGRWQVVTVGVPAAELLPGGRWPEPLRPLAGAVELDLRPAPGGRGTELAVRPLGGLAALPGMAAHLVGDDPDGYLWQVLRAVRQLVETGEVLRADRPAVERPAPDRPAVPG
ncbi:hypothetical protein [Micromonospora sp. HM134]|uniref:hypothetical protein n=1 Tax=Micromonospora sp. HM134 TaxID=2583243 RepID=UPI00351B7851